MIRNLIWAVIFSAMTISPTRAAGEDIDYILETCFSCHRSGSTGAIIGLTGRPGIFTVQALAAYRSGERKSAIMETIARDIDPNIVGMIAAFLAKMR